MPTLSVIAGATVTQTAVYATKTIPRPSPVASGTTKDCGKYYVVQYVSRSSPLYLFVLVHVDVLLPLPLLRLFPPMSSH